MSTYQYDSFWNTFKRGFMRIPTVIRSIIAINVIVFVLMVFAGQTIVNIFGFNPDPFTALTQPWRIITYMFVHGGPFHLIFNMLWLWWMGRMVEETIGPRSFSVIYFGAGIGGALLQIAFASVLGGSSIVIGASGAVLGTLVAFAYLFPTAPIMLLFLPPIEARFLVAGLVALDVLFLGAGDNVARLVHLGGAGSGFLLVKMHYEGFDLSSLIRPIEQLFKGKGTVSKKSKRKRNKDMYAVSDVEIMEEEDVDELDEILEKISKKGYDGLTKEEKQKLFELSKRN